MDLIRYNVGGGSFGDVTATGSINTGKKAGSRKECILELTSNSTCRIKCTSN